VINWIRHAKKAYNHRQNKSQLFTNQVCKRNRFNIGWTKVIEMIKKVEKIIEFIQCKNILTFAKGKYKIHQTKNMQIKTKLRET
jgi:hypothetical protein